MVAYMTILMYPTLLQLTNDDNDDAILCYHHRFYNQRYNRVETLEHVEIFL